MTRPYKVQFVVLGWYDWIPDEACPIPGEKTVELGVYGTLCDAQEAARVKYHDTPCRIMSRVILEIRS